MPGAWDRGKAQSGLEYLMNYGWAVLMIVIVLGILYAIGILNFSNITQQACTPATGFSCTNLTLNTSGYLAATVGTSIGSLSITGTGCSNSTNAPPSNTFVNQSPTVPLVQGSQVVLVFKCPVFLSQIGAPFQGTIWLKYNQTTENSLVSTVGAISLTESTSNKV